MSIYGPVTTVSTASKARVASQSTRNYRVLASIAILVLAAWMGTLAIGAGPASAEDRVPAEVPTQSTETSPVKLVTLGEGQATISTAVGSFRVNDDGSASIVDDSGEELLPLQGTAFEGSVTTPATNYTLVGDNLSITWDTSASDGPNMAAAAKAITWGCVVAYLGLALGTAGFIVATGGTATVFLLSGGSYVVSLAGLLASC